MSPGSEKTGEDLSIVFLAQVQSGPRCVLQVCSLSEAGMPESAPGAV